MHVLHDEFRQIYKMFILALLLIILMAFAPASRLQAEDEVSEEIYTSYFPLIQWDYHPCHDNPNIAKGVAWAHFTRRESNDHERLCIGWYHRWQITAERPLSKNVEFIQHFWCDVWPSDAETEADVVLDYRNEALTLLGSNFDGYLLFLNEPDLPPPQCHRSPEVGAELYVWVKENLPQAKLIGPQISHGDYLNNWRWLIAWREAVIELTGEPPDMYAYSLHNYVTREHPSIQLESLYALMRQWGDEDKPIWVTEYGSKHASIVAEMTRYYASEPRVERFAGFSPYLREESAVAIEFIDWDTGEFTPLGEAFRRNGN